MSEIDTGDVVTHCPSGEEWLVAYVDGERLAWCGWPSGTAPRSDCVLTRKATQEQRYELLQLMAAIDSDDPRRRYARAALGLAA